MFFDKISIIGDKLIYFVKVTKLFFAFVPLDLLRCQNHFQLQLSTTLSGVHENVNVASLLTAQAATVPLGNTFQATKPF